MTSYYHPKLFCGRKKRKYEMQIGSVNYDPIYPPFPIFILNKYKKKHPRAYTFFKKINKNKAIDIYL